MEESITPIQPPLTPNKPNYLMYSIIFLLIVAVGFLSYFVWTLKVQLGKVSEVSSTTESSAFSTINAEQSPVYGTVIGKLCYPSDFLPGGEIVAKDLSSGKMLMQDYPGSAAGGGQAYEFSLKPGRYNLRYQAHIPKDSAKFLSGYHMCYTAASTNEDVCNGTSSHSLIAVKVEAGKTTEGINLCDFYYSNGGEPSF